MDIELRKLQSKLERQLPDNIWKRLILINIKYIIEMYPLCIKKGINRIRTKKETNGTRKPKGS